MIDTHNLLVDTPASPFVDTDTAAASLMIILLQWYMPSHAKFVCTHQLRFVAQHVNASLD